MIGPTSTCPTCRRVVEGTRAEIPTLPFCSPRCRTIDLGGWLSESYKLTSAASEEDLDAGIPEGTGGGDDDDAN